jgi:hypothetical protein
VKDLLSSCSPLVGLGLALALAGCGSESQSGTPTGVTQSGVVTFATFARILDEDARVAEGLNIDGVNSTDGDLESCGKKVYTSPEGDVGVDNQFGGLLPVIESKVGSENLGQLLATAIANGQLLVLLSIEGLDDPTNDDEVTVKLAAGTGLPLLDSKGKFITYQSFGLDRETAPVSTLPGKVTNGVLDVGPGEAVLPVRVLDAKFNLNLHGARGRFVLTPEARGGGLSMNGMISGGLVTAEFKGIVEKLNIKQDVISAAVTLVALVADLGYSDESGTCTQVSAALKIETTPAFIVE